MNTNEEPVSLLFVYGTLRRGCDNPHARMLADNSEFLGEARMPGRLLRFDWHPGAVEAGQPGSFVRGEVFRLRDPLSTLATLDEYEGADFQRARADVDLQDGQNLVAWVYLYRGPKKGQPIASGDWFEKA